MPRLTPENKELHTAEMREKICRTFAELFQNLFEVHIRAVEYLAALARVFQKLRVDERAGVNDHVGFFQQVHPADCDQIRSAAAGAYEMDHISDAEYNWEEDDE